MARTIASKRLFINARRSPSWSVRYRRSVVRGCAQGLTALPFERSLHRRRSQQSEPEAARSSRRARVRRRPSSTPTRRWPGRGPCRPANRFEPIDRGLVTQALEEERSGGRSAQHRPDRQARLDAARRRACSGTGRAMPTISTGGAHVAEREELRACAWKSSRKAVTSSAPEAGSTRSGTSISHTWLWVSRLDRHARVRPSGAGPSRIRRHRACERRRAPRSPAPGRSCLWCTVRGRKSPAGRRAGPRRRSAPAATSGRTRATARRRRPIALDRGRPRLAAADDAAAGVDPLVQRDVLDRMDHVLAGELEDRGRRRVLGPRAESPTYALDHRLAARRVERHLAAEEEGRIDVAEHEAGVGDRRLVAAPAVAAGPGTAPALCGPTCKRPPLSTQAMLPPPAPMLRASTEGNPVM